MVVEKFPDRTITVDGKELLYFGGTSYLGIATNKEFNTVLSKEIENWGSFYGSSRNSNIKLSIYEEFERFFSSLVKSESSLAVSSGTIAGRLVIDALSCGESSFFHYPKTHPAILQRDSIPLFLEGKLHPKIVESRKIVITLDAVCGGELEATKLDFLNEIPENVNLTLLIDESHSLGILGENGNGIFSEINHKNINRKIMVASLGKALGLAGGIIVSDRNFIDKIQQNSIFVSSSGMNPAYLATFLKTQKIYDQQKEKLKSNLKYLSVVIKGKAINFNENYPVIYIEGEEIYDNLLKKEVVITSFKYPTYKKTMNRIVITANHTFKDLEKLISVL